METPKKNVFSGIKPTGRLTLGSYLGALNNWIAMQADYNCIYCIVDLHALTIRNDPAVLQARTLEQMAQYLACGLDVNRSVLFIQSHVPAHAQLAWILNCYTMFGELSRMTQFKDKSQKTPDNINAGLFTYPALMAADILLYDTDAVPVGEDQKQHVEITRDIAGRFNGLYGPVFRMPEPIIPKLGARVKSLTHPEEKMSKSDDDIQGSIFLLDPPEVIMKKCKRAVTDSDGEIRYDPVAKPGVSNLLTLYSLCAGRTVEQAVQDFAGQGYGRLKTAAGEAIVAKLAPIREQSETLLQNKDFLHDLMRHGRDKAQQAAAPVLNRVHDVLGLISL